MTMGPWQVPNPLPVVKWQGGELLAWRVWRLARAQDGGLRLVSYTRDTVWDGPVLTADRRPHAVPGCGSGVYAMKPGTRPHMSPFDWALDAQTWVRGWVALSGQVVEHQLGYRGERAVIRRLRLGPAAHRCFRSPEALVRVRDELEQRYQCPVKITGVDARIARRFASSVTLPVVLPAGTAAWPTFLRVRRWPRLPKGVSPDGIRYDEVERAFARAERLLGTDWSLKGRGHCRRVTLESHYARRARLGAARSSAFFTPQGAMSPHWVFPLALVLKAGKILAVEPGVLISQEF